jgi:hypothetical protein
MADGVGNSVFFTSGTGREAHTTLFSPFFSQGQNPPMAFMTLHGQSNQPAAQESDHSITYVSTYSFIHPFMSHSNPLLTPQPSF